MDQQIPQPIHPSEWPPVLSNIIEDMHGDPINVHRLMANNPALLEAWWPFRNHSVLGGTLGQRNAELLILRLSVHMECWYEWGSHVDRATKIGIERNEILGLLKPDLDQQWPEGERVLILSVDELMTRKYLGTETRTLLEEHFDTNQIMDLIAIHGMYIILAAMLKTWDLSLDSKALESIFDITSEVDFLRSAELFNMQS